jgi:hypothetical protein
LPTVFESADKSHIRGRFESASKVIDGSLTKCRHNQQRQFFKLPAVTLAAVSQNANIFFQRQFAKIRGKSF